MDINDIRWEDPPSKDRNWDKYRPLAGALITRTGEWAVASEFKSRHSASSLIYRIKSSAGPWSGHKWEARSRRVDDLFVVYVRHVSAS